MKMLMKILKKRGLKDMKAREKYSWESRWV